MTEDKQNQVMSADEKHSVTRTRYEVDPVEQLIAKANKAILLTERLSRTLVWNSISTLILVILLCIATYYAFNKKTVYFSVTPDGTITQLYPLSFPTVDDSAITLFARDSMNDVFNLDFDTYRAQLEKGRRGFDSAGFAALLQAMEKADIFKIMERDRVNTRVFWETPILTRKGAIDGVYQWQVQIPMTLKFVGQNTSSQPIKYYLIATVSRVDTSEKTQGIVISQVVTRPRNN